MKNYSPKIKYLFNEKLNDVNSSCCKTILVIQSNDFKVISFCAGRFLIFIEIYNNENLMQPLSNKDDMDDIRGRFFTRKSQKKQFHFTIYFPEDITGYVYDHDAGVIFVLTTSGELFAISEQEIITRMHPDDRMEVDCRNDSDIFTNLLMGDVNIKDKIVPKNICSINGAYDLHLVNSCLHVLFVKDQLVGVSVCSFAGNERTGGIKLDKQESYHIMQRHSYYLPKIFFISIIDRNVSINKTLFTSLLGKSPAENPTMLFCSEDGAIYYKSFNNSDVNVLCDVKQPVRHCLSLTLKECSNDMGNIFPPINMSTVTQVCDEIKNNMVGNNCLSFVSDTGKCVSVFQQDVVKPTRALFYESQLISPVLSCDTKEDVLVISNESEIYAYQAFLKIRLLKKPNDKSELKDNLKVTLEFKLLHRMSIPNVQMLYVMNLNPFEVIAYRHCKLMLLVCEKSFSGLQNTANISDFINNFKSINENINRAKQESSKMLDKLFQLSTVSLTVQNIKSSQKKGENTLPIDISIVPRIICNASKKELLVTCNLTNNMDIGLPDGYFIHLLYYKDYFKNLCKQTGRFTCKSETILIPIIESQRQFEFSVSIHEDFIGFSPLAIDFYLQYSYGIFQQLNIKEFGTSCFLKHCLLDIPELCSIHSEKDFAQNDQNAVIPNEFFSFFETIHQETVKKYYEFSVALSADAINNLPPTTENQQSLKSTVFYFLFGKSVKDHITLSHLNGETIIVSVNESDQGNILLLTLTSTNIPYMAWVHNYVLNKLKKYLAVPWSMSAMDLREQVQWIEGLLERTSIVNATLSSSGTNFENNDLLFHLNEILQVYSDFRRATKSFI